MRASAILMAFIALFAMSFGQTWRYHGQIRQRYHMRAEVVVSGTVGNVYAGGFNLRTGSGTYRVQVGGNTIISSSLSRGTRGIVPGSLATVTGFRNGSTIMATHITVRRVLRPWNHRIPPQ